MDMLRWLAETNIQAAIIGPLVSGLITVGGWCFKRKNDRKTHIAHLIQEIEELGVEHWCCPGSDTNNHLRAIKITGKLKTLSWKIDQKKGESIKKALIEYRQAITSGQFEETSRPAHPFEDPRIALIYQKAKDLRKTLGLTRHH